MTWSLEKAVTLTRDGRERRAGFDLFFNGHWHERFDTKREAIRYVRCRSDDRGPKINGEYVDER